MRDINGTEGINLLLLPSHLRLQSGWKAQRRRYPPRLRPWRSCFLAL